MGILERRDRMKPNIILIMTDDQGYGDLSCMGAKDFVTPNIDRLAENGSRFTSFYSASPVCSPSRASLLTGRYPYRAGVRSILAGSRTTTGLTNITPTIASAVKKEGYDTAVIGKWHLGLEEKSRPLKNGFDYFYGFMAGCIDYYSHIFYWGQANGVEPIHDLWENEREIFENGTYFTQAVTERSVSYIRQKAAENQPFLLYIGYNAPHYPMHAPQKYLDRFPDLSPDRRIMAAMLSAVDDGVGEIMDELSRTGQLENTIIYFQSDNGPSRESRNWLDGTPDPYYGGTAGKLKGHKFSLFEGGIRVPAIISYPAKLPKGQVIEEPCCAIDIFPTLLRLIGADSSGYEVDGKDITDMIQAGAPCPHEALFWEMGEQTAVRKGDYKLVLNGQLVETEPPMDPVFLSNIKEDMGETTNLVKIYPKVAEELTQIAQEWRNQVEQEWQAGKEHYIPSHC